MTKSNLSVAPKVHAKMMAHAIRNSHSVVHGILLGKYGEELIISDVLPVCHSTPTKPILDMSLRLAEAYCLANDDNENLEIIGWYTAPEKQVDESPGPVALKIIRSIASNSESKEPVLICITNNDVENFLKIEKPNDIDNIGFSVYGKDGGNHWNDLYKVESIKSSIGSWSASNQAAVDVSLDDELKLYDFEDHVSSGSAGVKDKDWIRNENIGNTLKQRLAQQ